MKKNITIIIVYMLFCVNLFAQNKEGHRQWFDNKYSMFIHFGLYSELGGVWKDKPVTQGYSEQIQSHAGIFSNWYANTAKKFNPQLWNADSIVQLAIDAGMKSIVITSKHHDGFCMYHSKYTDFNIVDATPFKRDVVKELSEACAKRGMAFGIYFSLIDWHFPQAYPISSHNADPITPEHHEYNKNQVTELMQNYGSISEIWFDMGSQTESQSRELYELVHKYQPDCMVSGRIGNGYGDFCVMGDNEIPETQLAAAWQTPASMFPETWGYRSWQKYVDVTQKTHEKIQDLVNVVSAGGNYLLNIGPKGDGSVVSYEKEVLLNVGKWVKTYQEAVYATQANPFQQFFDWGNVTTKGNTIYLLVKKIPESHSITLPRISGKIKNARILNTNKNISCKTSGNSINVNIPDNLLQGKFIEVIALTFAEPFTVSPKNILMNPIALDTANATSYHSFAGKDYYGLKQTTIFRKWFFNTPSQKFTPVLHYTDKELGKEINVSIDGVMYNCKLERKSSVMVSIPDQGITERFSMEMNPVQMQKKAYHTIELELANRTVPHNDMGLDNLVIELRPSPIVPK